MVAKLFGSKIAAGDEDARHGQHDCEEGKVAPQLFLDIDRSP